MRIYMKSRLKSKYLLLIVIIQFFGCKEKQSKEEILVNKYFDEMNISENKREGNFILLPGTGCFGCTEKTITWLIENKENTKDYKLIFGSRKENTVYIDSLQNMFSIYYDDNNKMERYEFGYGYPFFIRINPNKETKIIPFNSEATTPFGF